MKVSILGGDTQAVANVVSNERIVDVGLASNRTVSGPLQMVVNARVAMEPTLLEEICRDAVSESTSDYDGTLQHVTSHALRPGRPEPTHRVTAG